VVLIEPYISTHTHTHTHTHTLKYNIPTVVWKFKIKKGIPLPGFSLKRSFISTKRDLTYISKVSRMHAKRLIHSDFCGALRGGGHTHSDAHKNVQTPACTHIYTHVHTHTHSHIHA